MVVVGDGAVGKTCMLVTYTRNAFPEDYVPTVFDNYASNTQVDGVTVNLQLWDTAGQEDYARLRPLAYPETDVFLLAYAIDMPVSLENVRNVWWRDVHTEVPKAQLILVGTKKDLRGADPSKTYVTPEQAKKVAEEIKAARYLECSAKTREGLKEIFEEAVRVYLQGPATVGKTTSKKSKKDCLLI